MKEFEWHQLDMKIKILERYNVSSDNVALAINKE